MFVTGLGLCEKKMHIGYKLGRKQFLISDFDEATLKLNWV